MKKIFGLIFSISIAACSGGGGGGGATTPSALWASNSVTSAASLPVCAGDIIGRLYYVESPPEFDVCEVTGWRVISIQGANGTNGSNGTNGTNGTNNKFSAGIICVGTVSGLSGAAGTALNGLIINYKAYVTNAGDVIASASIDNGSLIISNTGFYSVTQAGASTGAVFITADFATANGGWWNISTNRTSLVVTAVYTDSSLGGSSPVTMTFVPSACTTYSF